MIYDRRSPKRAHSSKQTNKQTNERKKNKYCTPTIIGVLQLPTHEFSRSVELSEIPRIPTVCNTNITRSIMFLNAQDFHSKTFRLKRWRNFKEDLKL